MSSHTLSELVDLSLRFDEKGAVNFSMLHTVLMAILEELDLKDLRPSGKLGGVPLMSKLEQMKARLKEKVQDSKSLEKDVQDSKSLELLMSKLAQMKSKLKGDARKSKSEGSVSEVKKEESLVESEGEEGLQDEQLSSKKDIHLEDTSVVSHTQIADDDERTEDQTEPTDESKSLEDHQKPSTEIHKQAKDFKKAEEGWKYTQLDSRVNALEEGMNKIAGAFDMMIDINDRLKKIEAQKSKGGPPGSEIAEIWQEVEKLEQAFTVFQEESKRRKGGTSSAELEELEDRIEVLEEAKLVFDQDHVALEEVLKVQNQMTQEFEEIKALGNEIKEMKNAIALKAGIKEMEEALTLKGDLSLLLTKVDQVEFETAIEELGEAIGTLGIKFTRKNEKWEEQIEDIRRAIDAKMSRDVFDSAVSKIESRIVAIMDGLKSLKKVMEQLLYPDSSGVTKCILCKRPAAISGHECFDMKELPKRPHKSADSDLKCSMSIIKNEVNKEMVKKQKVFGAQVSTKSDTVIRIPYSSSTYQTEHTNKVSEEPELKLAPIRRNRNDSNEITRSFGKLNSTQCAKNQKSRKGTKSSQKVEIVLPKREPELPHRELIFTQQMLQDTKKQDKSNFSSTSNSTDIEFTNSREERVTSEIPGVMNDSLQNVECFAPLKLMPDPLRREIIRSSNPRQQQSLNLCLAPLYPKSTSRRNAS